MAPIQCGIHFTRLVLFMPLTTAETLKRSLRDGYGAQDVGTFSILTKVKHLLCLIELFSCQVL